MLQRKPLFADCTANDLEPFVEAMVLFELTQGEIIVLEGKAPQYLFIISYGRIGQMTKGKVQGEISRGEDFCMNSFLTDSPRLVTAMTLDPTGLWAIDRATFDQLFLLFKSGEGTRVKNYLDGAGVFMGLLPEQKESLQEVMAMFRLQANETIVEENTPGDACFIVKAGTVACSKDGKEIRRLGPGELFGEQALLNGGHRTATVRTVTAVVMWKIERMDLVFALGDHLDRIMYRNCIRIAFDGNPILSRLSQQQKEKVIARMRIIVINQGEVGIVNKSDQLFVVLQGALQSTTNPAKTLQTFSILGALLEANSQAKGESEHFVATSETAAIASIELCTLERRLQGSVSASVARKPTFEDLKKIPLFMNLSESLLQSLVKYAAVRSFSPNEVIVSEKDSGNSLFVVVSGEVNVTQKNYFIRTMGVLDYFGERALLSAGKRTATVTAKTDTICWSFEKGKLQLTYKNDSLKPIFLARIALQDTDPQLTDLIVVKYIPADVPGAPFLVVHSTKLEFYVMQVVDRAALNPTGLRDLEIEKQLLQSLYHPFFLRYIKSFDDRRFSYLLSMYENGSTLFEVLRDFGRELTEEEAKFYLSCLILIMEFLHTRKICIRNLKPENILIDSTGYPLLANLEYAKVMSEKSFTMVGTPHYLAPEMITKKGYGLEVDYWSLGVLLYESLYGKVPFGDTEQSPMRIYSEILNGEVNFHNQLSPRVREVITSLLEQQPARRANGSLSKLKKLPWLERMAWVSATQDSLIGRKAKAPYQPQGKDLKQMLPRAMAKGETTQHALSVLSM